MSSPQNSILGNFQMPSFDVDTPAVPDADQQLTAKGAKTAFWKQQREYLQSRIEYWQHFLPDGTAVDTMSTAERAQRWVDADNAIREINLWLANVETITDATAN